MTKKVGVLFLALIMISVMLLPGCDDENTLYVYNWGDYMDMQGEVPNLHHQRRYVRKT
jgi:spermidine/putrescine-binding protein